MNVQRRQLLKVMAGLSLIASPMTWAQTNRRYRIMMILFRGETDAEQGFRSYFTQRNIPVDFITRDLAQDLSKIPELIAEARRLKVDLIYTWGTPTTLAVVGKQDAKNKKPYVNDIPVVFTMVASPEGVGLVNSRNSSQRNITGTSHVASPLEQFSAMQAYRAPKKMAALYNPAESNSVFFVQEMAKIAKKAGVEFLEYPIALDAEKKPIAATLPHIIKRIAKEKPQYVYLGPDSFIAANRHIVTEAALENKLAIFSATEAVLRDGKALFGLASRYEQVGLLTAHKAMQILSKQKNPQDIPIETLTRFSYIVNMSVAAELNFYPPLKVVNYAEIIQ